MRKLLTPLLLALSTFLSACSPVGLLNALSPTDSYSKTANIAYGNDPRQQLDIYTPTQKKAGPTPVVLFFYGGSWNSGERADYQFVGEALASRGYVAVIADYRLYPQVRYPDFLKDSAHAFAWVHNNIATYGGDAQHLFVMGHSAGAYNAAMLALDPRLLAAEGLSPANMRGWIGLAGPYDFLPIKNPDVRPVFFYPNSPPDSQPINHISATVLPTLLIAARDDELVNPQRNTAGLAKRLRGAGVPVSEHYYDGVSHITLVAALSKPLRGKAPALEEIVRFIDSDAGRKP
ncbi:MAG: alpha/beta hydrolase [Pseudomonas sp.]|uniref:alpha/beta hydrolase n=1 Tax=Pseudomonas sp. TaxID=306 RepID=UPI0030F10281